MIVGIELKDREENRSASTIPIGTVFTGRIGYYPNRLFLMTREKIVALDALGTEWNLICKGTPFPIIVKDYLPRKIKIVEVD